MTKLSIENCHVDFDSTRASLSCDYQGARYHIWLNADRSIQDTLYKNPLSSNLGGSPGHFQTRRLTTTSKFSSALIGEMLRCMDRDSLYERAVEAHAKRTVAEARKRRLHETVYLIIGADSNGHLHFVPDSGGLTQNIRQAVIFTDDRLEQAEHLADHPDNTQACTCPRLVVLAVTAGQLANLTGDVI